MESQIANKFTSLCGFQFEYTLSAEWGWTSIQYHFNQNYTALMDRSTSFGRSTFVVCLWQVTSYSPWLFYYSIIYVYVSIVSNKS